MRKLNAELIEKYAEYISKGMSFDDTAALCDISVRAVYNWRAKGEADIENNADSIEALFVQTLKKAQSKDKEFHISNIRNCAEKNWQASAWWLERRYPKEFGKLVDDSTTAQSAINKIKSLMKNEIKTAQVFNEEDELQ